MKEYKNGAVKFDLEELNTLSIYAAECAEYYRNTHCELLAIDAQKMSDLLYKICEKHGLYVNSPDSP